jgi:toxin ParE1/3/4
MYAFIADLGGEERAMGYIDRIETFCRRFRTFPERGTRRDDIRAGLRVTGFERQVAIAFHVSDDAVIFDRFLSAGRSLELSFLSDD